MSDEQDWVAVVRHPEMERRRREDERASCIAGFIERQRSKRRWIPFFGIADQHGLSAGPAGSDGYNQVREFALRSLSQSILDGEFERTGWSKVLYLTADISTGDSSPHFAWGKRWLERGPYRRALDATAPSLPLDVLGCCWLPRNLAWQWMEAHGSRWPAPGQSAPAVARLTRGSPIPNGENRDNGSSDDHPPADKSVRFANPVWDLRDVIGWVLDRNPAKFGRLMNEIDVQAAVFGAKSYTRWPRPEGDPDARRTLLHALQRGDLVAHQGERTLPREFWGSRTDSIQDFRHALRLGIWFWRDDAMRLWPEAGGRHRSGLPPQPHCGSAAMGPGDVHSGWIPVAAALDDIATPFAGDNAWDEIKAEIAKRRLHARCEAVDGVTTDFKTHWFPFVMRLEGEGAEGKPLPPRELLAGNTLYFDRHKVAAAREAGVFAPDLAVPSCVWNIELSLEDCRKLWPPGIGSASATGAVVPEQPPTPAPPEAVEATRARGKPGPKPELRDRLTAKMLDDLSSGRRTPEELKGDKLSALVAQYSGSPNTANAARQAALSRFSELQNKS